MFLPFDEFDVILCMDCLALHYAVDDELINVEVDKSDCLTNIISTISTRELIRKGCEICQSIDIKDGTSFDSQKIIDVFPEELLGLPFERELEFVIEIAPKTAPNSIATYRMALPDLK
ncbi:DNA/RNA polymerases superfamily protein [Gossypium australe]|uniref:DNA/RNA polymerases superfamily protein n=1 Tax=Gossypium australe TaxID=47621 RepID=A0A5B6V8V7_9ROSI|nr:DNA/RNA polymerases superfamily protein [Gossypium australe]